MVRVASSRSKFHRILDYWPYIVLLVPTFFIILPLTKPGAILHQDFPFIIHALSPSKALSTWEDFGSYNNFENLPRLLETSIGLIFLNIGITPEWISKLMVILVFYLASVSFYIFCTRLLRNKINLQVQLKVAAIVGSLYYAYNTWSFDTILHWHLWLGYAVLPLFFISVILAFQYPKRWKYHLVAVVSWSVASSSPHMLVFFGLIFIGVVTFFVIKKIHSRQYLIQLTTTAIIILSVFTLANAYWIYPAILVIESNELDLISTFGSVVTEESTRVYSTSSNFTNVFRFVQSANAQPHPSTYPLYLLWSSVSFLLPVIAFSALLSNTLFRYSVLFSLMAILGIYLVMGSNEPIGLYSILLFNIPYVSDIVQNLFRDPNRWSFLIAIGYSMLLSISTFEVLRMSQRIRPRYLVQGSFIFIILASIVIQSYYIYGYYLVDRYSPAIIPDDFDKLNKYLRSIDTDKVVYFPMLLYSDDVFHYVGWDNRTMFIADIYQWSSVKPSMGHYRDLFAQNYYRYLTSLLTANKTDTMSNLVSQFGTSYIIFHNDTLELGTLDIPANIDIINKLSTSADVRNIANIGFFNVFMTNGNITPINIPKYNIIATGGLDTLTSLNHLDSFNSNDTSLIFLDQSTRNEIDPSTNITNIIDGLVLTENANDLVLSSIQDRYIVAPFDATTHHNVSELWSKAGILDPWRGEFHPYLQELGMENWDFDYGKGLVITQAKGATLDLPFSVEKEGSYDIFARYMKNQVGGELKVYLDEELIGIINTKDDLANTFVWKNIISNMNLIPGEHTLTIENILGFNAVNIFTVQPTEETTRLVDNAHTIANKTRNIFLLEAESDFYSLQSHEASNIQTAHEGFNFGDFLESFATESERTVHLAPGSSVYTNLEIMKPSNYTIALHATNTCVVCDPLKISIQDEDGNFVVNNGNITQRGNTTESDDNARESALTWLYLDEIPLREGHNSIEIQSDSETDLDSVILYSSDDGINHINNDDVNSLDDIFSSSTPAPAIISDYTKINPTKYTVSITNATRPYILSFAESFDQFWRAYVERNNTDSRGLADNTNLYSPIPLYSLINGFYIDELGDYTIIIEYEPQQWLIQGGIISIVAIIVYATTYLVFHRYGMFQNLFNFRMKFLSKVKVNRK